MKKFKKLEREELKFITGGFMAPPDGAATCVITVYGPNYSNPQQEIMIGPANQANDFCVDKIATPGNGVYHCKYNCGIPNN